jgi:hypothetical protein
MMAYPASLTNLISKLLRIRRKTFKFQFGDIDFGDYIFNSAKRNNTQNFIFYFMFTLPCPAPGTSQEKWLLWGETWKIKQYPREKSK